VRLVVADGVATLNVKLSPLFELQKKKKPPKWLNSNRPIFLLHCMNRTGRGEKNYRRY